MLLLSLALPAAALDVPQLKGRVNDYAGLLTPAVMQKLDQQLADLEQSDSTQVVVLTIPSLSGEALETFSIRVAEAWRIGQKGVDNGAILLVARDEHKVRIEVGRGLEGTLTDLTAGRIIRNEIVPRLKNGDYDGGVLAGVTAIAATVRGEYQPAGKDLQHGKRGFHPSFTFVLFLFVLCVFLSSISRILGGLVGAAGLPLLAALSFSGISVVILVLLALAGFMLGLLIAFLFGGGGGGWGWGGPFGGFGGFGGSSGGGFGGGFSGGGGDFGGGGASGDW